MAQNELLAIALGIGRKLARQDWYKMSSAEAEQWCIEAASKHAISENEQRFIAAHAMNYVINGGN